MSPSWLWNAATSPETPADGLREKMNWGKLEMAEELGLAPSVLVVRAVHHLQLQQRAGRGEAVSPFYRPSATPVLPVQQGPQKALFWRLLPHR